MSKQQNQQDETAMALRWQTGLTLRITLGIAAVILIFYWVWFDVINGVPLGADAGAWGTFGDFIGGILNPIVAGCALYWLTRSVQIQREELNETKLELADARRAQEDQARTLEKQRFEDTFFSLLTQHNSILQSLNTPNPENNGKRSNVEDINFYSQGLTLAEAKSYLECHDVQCGHYFRVLYQILKLVATRSPGAVLSVDSTGDEILATPVEPDEKMYTNIVRAFLDVNISQLLAINCYCDINSSYWKFKCYIERYELLEHMPFEMNGNEYYALQEAKKFYDGKAFGKSDYMQ